MSGCFHVQLNGSVVGATLTLSRLDGTGNSIVIGPSIGDQFWIDGLGEDPWFSFVPIIRLAVVGIVTLPFGTNLDPDAYYLVEASGGSDNDPNLSKDLDESPQPVAGKWHALVRGQRILDGNLKVSTMTEAFYQFIKADLPTLTDTQLTARLDELASAVMRETDKIPYVNYDDALFWNSTFNEAQYRGQRSDLTQLANAITNGEDNTDTLRALATTIMSLDVPDLRALTYSDPLLALCIGFQEGKNNWNSIADAKTLDCEDSNIRLLGGLQALTALEELNLSDNQIDDIDPLTALDRLRVVDLSLLPALSSIAPLLGLGASAQVDLDRSGGGDIDCSSLDVLEARIQSLNRPENCRVLIDDVDIADSALRECVRSSAQHSSLTYTHELTQLECEPTGISQLDGLEQFANLQTLNISGNLVSDLTPLSQLSKLRSAFLNENPISDLSPLIGLPALETISLRRVPELTDVDALLAIPSLEEAYLDDTGDDELDCTTLDAMEQRFESFNRPRTCNMPIGEVEFADPALAACVADRVAAAQGALTFTNDLNNLACIDAGIVRLDGLERFAKVVSFTFIDNEIADLSPLAALPQLRGLALAGNNLKDLKALSSLRELRIIDAGNNPDLEDISTALYMEFLFDLLLSGSGTAGKISCADLDALEPRLQDLQRPATCDNGGVPPADRFANSDLNNDGNADIVLQYDNGNGAISWRIGRSVPAAPEFDAIGSQPSSLNTSAYSRGDAIAVADFDGDGQDDVLLQLDGLDDTRLWSVLISDGNSLPTGQGNITRPAGNDARALAFTDVNGDGFADLFFQEQIAGLVAFHLALGTGTGFGQPAQLFNFDPVTGGRPQIVALEDLNGDGTADLVYDRLLGERHCYVVRLFRNGAFERQPGSADCAPLALPFEWDTQAVGVADLNGDGVSELVISYEDRGRTEWSYYTLATGASGSEWVLRQFFAAVEANEGTAETVALSDLDNDGRADLLTEITQGNNRTWRAYMSRDYGRFEAQTWHTGTRDYRSVGVRDYNGDDFPDLLIEIPTFSGQQQIQTLYVRTGNGLNFSTGQLFAWYNDQENPRIVGVEEDGLTSVARDTSALIAWAGVAAVQYTPNELAVFLAAKNLTFMRGNEVDSSAPMPANHCKIGYTKSESRTGTAGVGIEADAEFGLMVCTVMIGDRISIKTQVVYGGCKTAAGLGAGASCEVGTYKGTVKVDVIPGVSSADLVVKGPNAEACGGVSPRFICASAGAEVASTAAGVELIGVGTRAKLAVGIGAGADFKLDDGVISGEIDLKFLVGGSIELSLDYAETGDALYKVGETSYVFLEEGGELLVVAAGPAITDTVDFAGDAVEVAAGNLIFVSRTAGNIAIAVARDTGEKVELVVRNIERFLDRGIDAVGGVVVDIGEGIANGAGALIDLIPNPF